MSNTFDILMTAALTTVVVAGLVMAGMTTAIISGAAIAASYLFFK